MTPLWLISADALQDLQRWDKLVGKGMEFTPEQRASWETSKTEALAPRELSMKGDTAQIEVKGVLTKEPDLFAFLFGGANTTYAGIQDALAAAENNASVKDVELVVDSPGGQVDGLFDTLGAIQSFKKPMRVSASQAQSAAYAIAVTAGKITASNRAATFGSIGTAMTMQVPGNTITFTNTDSPDKRPDPTTEEGREVIVRHLDAVNELFVDAVAEGRKVSTDTVSKKFGRGATLLAGEAERLGMIDGIAGPVLRAVPQETKAAALQAEEDKGMDLKTLKLQHPAVYEAAVAEGVSEERDRVCAHLTMGEQSGDITTAVKAIRDGLVMTQSLLATYMAAGMNRNDRQARQDDSDTAAAATNNADTKNEASDFKEQVLSKFEELMGVQHG